MSILMMQKNDSSLSIVMLIVGLLCLFFAVGVVFLYRKKIIKEKKNQETFKLKEIQTKYKIFYFWGHVVYLFLIFTLFVASIIFLSIFFGSI